MPAGAMEAVSDSDPQPKKVKSRKLLVTGTVVALAALGGSGVNYFYAGKPAADNAKATEKVPHKLLLYVPMETFTVNLRNVDQERYLQVTINLEVADAMTAESLKQQMPSIRNRVLLLLSSKDAGDLMPREGKEKLSAEIGVELRKMLDNASPSKGLEQVLFSHFVIQ
jgi:flagellar FliL protein